MVLQTRLGQVTRDRKVGREEVVEVEWVEEQRCQALSPGRELEGESSGKYCVRAGEGDGRV